LDYKIKEAKETVKFAIENQHMAKKDGNVEEMTETKKAMKIANKI